MLWPQRRTHATTHVYHVAYARLQLLTSQFQSRTLNGLEQHASEAMREFSSIEIANVDKWSPILNVANCVGAPAIHSPAFDAKRSRIVERCSS